MTDTIYLCASTCGINMYNILKRMQLKCKRILSTDTLGQIDRKVGLIADSRYSTTTGELDRRRERERVGRRDARLEKQIIRFVLECKWRSRPKQMREHHHRKARA